METLFAGRTVPQHMTDQLIMVRTYVATLPGAELERLGTAGAVDALMARCALAVPKVDEDRIGAPKVEERGSFGAEVTVSVPFTGDRTLLFVRPSRLERELRAEVEPTDLVFSYDSPTRDPETIRAEADRITADVRAALQQLERDFLEAGGRLRIEVQREVEGRQQVLEALRVPRPTQR
jgi:hypothetical protein